MIAVDVRKRLFRERLRWLWAILMVLLAIGGLSSTGILYTNSVERRQRADLTRLQEVSQHDFCDLMRVFDDPTAPPPTTERGRRQVAAIRDYLAKRC